MYHVNGNPITDLSNMIAALTEILRENNDTVIAYIICKWANKQYDMPAFAMRQALLELDEQNHSAKMVVCTDAEGKEISFRNLAAGC